jgi:sarcosine oxidase subunit delta
MMRIDCPHCGPRAQAEFAYERTLDSIVTLDMPADEAVARLYARANPRGLDDELWRHGLGCRQWIVLRRHRVTHKIVGVAPFDAALHR